MPIVVAVIIAGVWAALLGTAYVARVARCRRVTRLGAVTACYLVLAAGALLWLGPGPNGWLAAAGMLAPFTAAVALAVLARPGPG